MSETSFPTDGQVREFVERRYGVTAAASAVPVGAGEWSRAFAVSASVAGEPPQDLVIRFGSLRADFGKDRLMGELVRERATGVPVPRVLEIGETPWGFYVTAERRRGRYLDELSGDEIRLVLPDLMRTLDEVAGLAPSGPGYGPWDERTGAAPFRTWREALLSIAEEQPRTAGWRAALETRPVPAAVFADGLAALDASLRRLERGWTDTRRAADGVDVDVAAGPRRIVHGDLLHRNVLVDVDADRGGTVTAVLDWGNSQYGDPLYDLAWLMFWWPWYPAWSAIDIEDEIRRHLSSTGRRPADLDARIRAYQVHIGLNSLAYNALTRRWSNLDRVADQLVTLLRR